MNEDYYQTGLKPVLLKNFQRICQTQNFLDANLLSAISDKKDPCQLLEHLRKSDYFTSSKHNEMITSILIAIEEITAGDRYYTTGGYSTSSVINDFAKLIHTAGSCDQEEKVTVPKQEEHKVKQVAICEEGQDIKQHRPYIKKDDKGTCENERITPGSDVDYNKKKRDSKSQKDGDGDWVLLEEAEIDDFVVIDSSLY